LEHASSVTMSDYRYNRAFLDAALYTHFGRAQQGWQTATPQVFSAHLRLGFVRALGGRAGGGIDLLHPRKRFYAGGAQSVRGYGENQLGPRILTIAPDKLAHAATMAGAPASCDPITDAVRYCDPGTGGLRDVDFNPQPLGGTTL